jgi:hypothetical protein
MRVDEILHTPVNKLLDNIVAGNRILHTEQGEHGWVEVFTMFNVSQIYARFSGEQKGTTESGTVASLGGSGKYKGVNRPSPKRLCSFVFHRLYTHTRA